jgi:hypothetical protein
MTTLWATLLLQALKKARFCTTFFYMKNFAKYGPDPKLFRARIRIGINSSGSTALLGTMKEYQAFFTVV